MLSKRSLTLVPALGAIAAAAMWVLLSGGAPARAVTNSYVQTNLLSDATDSKLINPWGNAFFPDANAPFWINDQGTGVSELIDGKGKIMSGLPFVTVPSSGAHPSGPTGIVANGTGKFMITGGSAFFIFDGLDGTITAWNQSTLTKAVIAVNNSTTARYTGLAMATIGGSPFLYAANSAKAPGIDVFDSNFKPFKTTGDFVDPALPAGFKPYGIANIEGNLFVTYGAGAVDEFSPQGVLMRRFATGGTLNQPWAVVIAPPSFGLFSNALLIGNFGDGTINAFNFTTKAFLGQLQSKGVPLKIDGLWSLVVGASALNVTNPNALYYTAGPNGQTGGLFGYILPSGAGPTPTATKHATPIPTKRPTPTHTKRATPTATKHATPAPTKRGTPTATKHATPAPTKRPTAAPTKRPSPTPTSRPTATLAKQPTATPTYYYWYMPRTAR